MGQSGPSIVYHAGHWGVDVRVRDTGYGLTMRVGMELGKWPRKVVTKRCHLCVQVQCFLVRRGGNTESFLDSSNYIQPTSSSGGFIFSIPLVGNNYYRIHISHFVCVFFFLCHHVLLPYLPFLSWAFETGSYKVAQSGLNLWPSCLSLLSAESVACTHRWFLWSSLLLLGDWGTVVSLLSLFCGGTILKEDLLFTTAWSSSSNKVRTSTKVFSDALVRFQGDELSLAYSEND